MNTSGVSEDETQNDVSDKKNKKKLDLNAGEDGTEEETSDESDNGEGETKVKSRGVFIQRTNSRLFNLSRKTIQRRRGSYIGNTTISDMAELLPIRVTFKNICYSVKERKSKLPWKKKERKIILKDLNGTFRPGEVTAIMGPSGAGKTTLLNILAGRIQGGKVRGSVIVNGKKTSKVSNTKWQKMSAYIMQDDVLLGDLTVTETLSFAASLRYPGGLNTRKRRQRVQALIEELGLEDCARMRVGSADKRGISGGQRKRVSIGLEIIPDPSILFMDEPTSGLDSSTAYSLLVTLRKLAIAGRTIITTIHQPSADMFFNFDRVMLMSRGHIIYSGKPRDVVSYFSSLHYLCPKYTNPAEFIMNLAKEDSYISSKEDGIERVESLATSYRTIWSQEEWSEDLYRKRKAEFSAKKNPNRQKCHSILECLCCCRRRREVRKRFEGNFGPPRVDESELEEVTSDDHPSPKSRGRSNSNSSNSNSSSIDEELDIEDTIILSSAQRDRSDALLSSKFKVPRGPNFFIQLFILTYRSLLLLFRDPMMMYARFIQSSFLAILVGIVYLQIGDDQASVQNRQGALFFSIVNQIMMSMMTTLIMFPPERSVYIREHSTGTYGSLAYFLGKTIADIPFQLAFPVIFSIITYWMIGYDIEYDKFFIYLAAFIAVGLTAQSIGLSISTGTQNVGVSMALAPLVYIPLLLMGGLFINNDSIPDWLIWLKYLSVFKFGYEIVVLNEFDGLTFTCKQSERVGGVCRFQDGDDVIKALSFDEDETSIWINFLFLAFLFFFYRFIAYIALLLTAAKKKG